MKAEKEKPAITKNLPLQPIIEYDARAEKKDMQYIAETEDDGLKYGSSSRVQEDKSLIAQEEKIFRQSKDNSILFLAGPMDQSQADFNRFSRADKSDSVRSSQSFQNNPFGLAKDDIEDDDLLDI